MVQFNNSASVIPGSPGQLLGTPSPFSGYNPLNSGNQQLDMMFAQYAPQILNMFGMRDFLPQQFPAQNLMDQMVSAKYMRTMTAAEEQSRARGTEVLADRFIRMRGNFDHTQISPMGAAQFNTIAGSINNRTVMPMLEMMMGAQNAEDIFFGRRGDPTKLQQAVSSIGFYRPDSVTGGSMMSGESLQQFSNQIYNNLYGPDADLNDISGFSAGRVGNMMTDLARRGLLPQSMSRIGNQQRARELTNLGFDAATGGFADAALDRSIFGDTRGITDPNELAAKNAEIAKVRKAVQDNAPLEEIEKLAGGADTIRRIDASRVANSLKGYSEAVGAVRQIFGDNGMGNAPMGQLIAALEALTQNSMSAMTPAKIENLMRRTQMASREGGVSLEALMGLSARTGALAQQRGLTPEIAAFTNVTAMEYATSMRANGGFEAGFGRMDPDKAMLFLAEAGLNAEDSNVGRQLGALERIVQSGGDSYKNTDAAKMLDAVKRGDTSFVNAAGDTVNIAQELGRNPLEFMRGMVTNMGVSASMFDALVRDKATQEFKIGLEGPLGLARQGEEYKAIIGRGVANRGKLGQLAGDKIKPEDLAKISQTFSQNFGRDLIDLVDTTQTPEERLETLYRSLRRSFSEAAGGEAAGITQMAAIFGIGADGEKAAKEFLLGEYASAGIDLNQYGITTATAQQIYAANQVAAAGGRSAANNMRAGINMPAGDGSNFLQRFSDAAAGELNGRGSFLSAILNTVDSTAIENQLLSEVMEGTGKRAALETAFTQAGDLYKAKTIDTPEERAALAASATGSAGGFAAFVAQVGKSFGEERNIFKDKKLLTDAELEAKLRDPDKKGALAGAYAALRLGDETASQDVMVAELMKNMDADRLQVLQERGLLGQDEVTTKVVRDFINNDQVRLYNANIDDNDKARIEAFDRLGRQLDEGVVTGTTIAEAFGVTGDKAKEADAVIRKYFQGGLDSEKFTEELAGLGLEDQTANIDAMARFSKQANAMRGLSLAGARGAAQRRIAISRMAAVNTRTGEDGTIDSDSILARVVAEETEKGELNQIPLEQQTEEQQNRLRELNEKKLSPEEQKVRDDVVSGDDAAFQGAIRDAARTDGGKKRSDTVEAVMQDASKMAGTAASEAGGILGQITSAFSDVMGDLLKDLKVEVTKLPEGFATEMGAGMGASIVAGIAGIFGGGGGISGATAATAARGPLALAGTVTLEGLDKLVAQLTAGSAAEMAPGGIPVVPQEPTTQSG